MREGLGRKVKPTEAAQQPEQMTLHDEVLGIMRRDWSNEAKAIELCRVIGRETTKAQAEVTERAWSRARWA